MQDIRFDRQVAIVTGAGGGIGRGIALLLAQRGAKVVVNDYGGSEFGAAGGPDRAQAVVEEIRAAGGEAVANAEAVGSIAAAQRLREAALDAWGRVDMLANNAGVVDFGAIDAISDEALERVIEINYLGAFRLLRAVWGDMKQQGYGRVLNMSSNSSLGFAGLAPYGSSKAALLGLTANAACDGKPHGILVNSLLPAAATRLTEAHPDFAPPEMAPFRKWLTDNFQPHKVAPVAAYLLSAASLVSGEHFSVGAGCVSRLAFCIGRGFQSSALSPEQVAENFAAVRALEQSHVLASGAEDLQNYMTMVPFPAA